MIASTLVFRLDQVVIQYTCAQQSSPIRLLIVGQLNVTSATVCSCCYFLVVIVSVLGGADTLKQAMVSIADPSDPGDQVAIAFTHA